MKLVVIKTTDDASKAGHRQGHDEEVSREYQQVFGCRRQRPAPDKKSSKTNANHQPW
jgi:hypothetical protein